jgi:LmbE family N-acetylglucosaminyl deacetylase
MHRLAGLAALLLMVAAAVCLAWVAQLRSTAYHYDVTRDTPYDFTRSGARRIDAELRDGRLQLAAKDAPGDVLIVALRIQATLFGRWFEPRIEIDGAGTTFVQAFERGGSGLRYVNLSSFPGGSTIRMRGRYLKIGDQTVAIYRLHSDVDPAQQRILVISPHPDDAEIAAFGLYAQRDAYIVTIAAGEGGQAGPFSAFAGADACLEKGRTRAWNSVTIPMLGGLGRERSANLGYFDGTLQAMKADPAAEIDSVKSGARELGVFRRTEASDLIISQPGRIASWQNLVQDLEYVIQRVQPDLIVTPYPRLDAHPDHRMATVALIEALQHLQWRHGSLLLYTNHCASSESYPYGQSGDIVSLPPGIEGIAFDGILSNSLSSDAQARKRIALDAENDLRAAQPAESFAGAARFFKQQLAAAFVDSDESYARRAVRANELFFEVRLASLYEPGMAERIEAVR